MMAITLMIIMALKFITYNPTCVLSDAKREYIGDLLLRYNCDIMLLQETWLSHEREAILSEISTDFMCTAKSGMDTSVNILAGRPYGGVAILWRKSLCGVISVVNSNHNRICAILLSMSNGHSMLIINAYLPCDNQSQSVVDDEYTACLDCVFNLINQNDVNMIVLGGDLNTDLDRNNCHSKYLKYICNELRLRFAKDAVDIIDVTNTYEDASGSSSFIDHFVCSDNVINNMQSFSVIDDPLNSSNHKSVKMVIKFELDPLQKVDYRIWRSSIDWERTETSDLDRYKTCLDSRLENIKIPVDLFICNNVLCENEFHSQAIDKLCSTVTDICSNSGNSTLKHKRNSTIKRVPFWKEHI